MNGIFGKLQFRLGSATLLMNMVMFTIVLLTSCFPCNPHHDIGENATFLVDPSMPAVGLIVWSPKEEILAITSYSPLQLVSNISLYDLESQQLRVMVDTSMTTGRMDIQTWSPDGDQFVFYSEGTFEYARGLWLMDVDGIDPPTFLADRSNSAWSHVGGLAYIRNQRDNILVFVVDPETGKERLLLKRPGGFTTGFSWSSYGKQLLFTLGESLQSADGGDIFVLDVNTGEISKITTDGNNYDSSWSPSADLIAFTHVSFEQRPPSFLLHIAKSDGSCDLKVPGLGTAQDPTWSADGTRIAFIADGAIYFVDLVEVYGEEFFSEDFPCNIGE